MVDAQSTPDIPSIEEEERLPTYPVEMTTGKVLEVTAHRMVARAELTTFENFRRGAWVAELKIRNGEVESIDQRWTELSGARRWVRVHPTEAMDPHRVRSQTGSFLSR